MAAVVEPLRMPGRAGDPVAIPALGAVLEAAGRRVDPVVVVTDSGCGVGLTEVEAASLAFESGVTLTFFYSLLWNYFNVLVQTNDMTIAPYLKTHTFDPTPAFTDIYTLRCFVQ